MERQRLTIGPGGPLGPDGPSFPGGPCVETTYNHTWLTTRWGPGPAMHQCHGVILHSAISLSFRNRRSGDEAVPFGLNIIEMLG